ncbi:Mu transposase domain-containing protein [Novosphingobium aerophilum]|uniref:Mu transposase domain-containing protein n=1 Tax=Novosphingobium aerophilum TaxID=2839843 RepID=UPI00163DE53A
MLPEPGNGAWPSRPLGWRRPYPFEIALRQVTGLTRRYGNPRVHATTERIVNDAFAEKKPTLQLLPLIPFGAVLKLERRISHEGMVSVGGNYYSVPNVTRKQVVAVHSLADEICIFEDDRLIARHPLLEGPGRARYWKVTVVNIGLKTKIRFRTASAVNLCRAARSTSTPRSLTRWQRREPAHELAASRSDCIAA